MQGYDNSWEGMGRSGLLPKGTYFYVLDLGDGRGIIKGWIRLSAKETGSCYV